MLPTIDYIADVSIFDEAGLLPFNAFGRNANIVVPEEALQIMQKERENNLNYIRVLAYLSSEKTFTRFGDRCGCCIMPGSTLQIAARLENDGTIGTGHPVILAGRAELKRLREATSELQLEVIGLRPPAIWSGYIKRSTVQSRTESKIRLAIRESYNATAARFVAVTHTGRHNMRRLTFYGGDAIRRFYSDVRDIEVAIAQEYLDSYGVEVLFIGVRPSRGSYVRAHALAMSWAKAKYDVVRVVEPGQIQYGGPMPSFLGRLSAPDNGAMIVEHAERLNYDEALGVAESINSAPASSKIIFIYSMKSDRYESAIEQLSRDLAINGNVAVVTPYISGKDYLQRCPGY